jgi:hypothetical protein
LLSPLRNIVLFFGSFQLRTAILLYRMIAARVNRWLAVLLVISFIFSWTVFNNTFTGGLESALSMMMTVITWRMAVRYHTGEKKSYRYLGLIGLAAGLTILARLDNFILVGFLGIWLVFDRKSDSSLLLLDILVPILLVMVATIQRIGYNVPLVGLMVSLLTAAYILSGCVLFYLVGFYGPSPIHIPIGNWFFRGLLAGMISAGLAGGLLYLLGSRGMFNLFPRSVLVITVVAWILYSTVVRAWLARRVYAKAERTVLPLQASILKIAAWLKKPAVFLGPVFGLVGAYMVWSQINFNTVMPVSGQIKQWWGTLEVTTYGSPIHSLAGLQHYLYSNESPFSMLYEIVYAVTSTLHIPNFPDSTAAWLILAGAYLILLVYEQKKQLASWWDQMAILPLILATVYRVLYFYISGYVHMRSWYWTVETFLLFLLILIIFLDWYQMYPDSRGIRGMVIGITAVAALWISITTIRNIYRTYPPLRGSSDPHTYLMIPRLVESMTPPGAVIGTPGGGTLSYFIHDRRIINLDGLMNSKEYFDALKAGDTHPFLRRMNVRYVFANQYAILSSPPYDVIFSNCLEPLNQVFGKMLFTYTCN